MKKMSELNSADREKRMLLLAFVLVTVCLVAIWAGVIAVKVGFGKSKGRTNPEQQGTARVYDYGDMLTDSQEQMLEEKIAEVQEKISADIVIVILNESLAEKYPDLHYSQSDETDAYRGIRRYAESFWVENGFGWNEPGDNGNGIIMVDNIYREPNGWVYNWVAGAGDLRYSVADNKCEDLSQAFTDRLPYGDMPHYDQTYANALYQFVEDCGSFGSMVRGMLGWSLFTPKMLYTVLTSSLVTSVVVGIILVILFGLMFWHLSYNGKQRSPSGGGSLMGMGGIFLIAAVVITVLISFTVGIVLIAIIAVVMIFNVVRKKTVGVKKTKAPFAATDILEPDSYRVTDKEDQFLRVYTTSYTVHHDSGGSSGGGGFFGGGGFSGGGGGGGGFSGGGSHR